MVYDDNSSIDYRQMATRNQCTIFYEMATSSQMAIRFEMVQNNKSLMGNRQMAARCQIANSCELAAGNWQSDANSISEDFRQFKVKRKSANGSQLSVRTFL